MDNGWQTKCGVKLPCSSSGVTSSSDQIQLQDVRNQIYMNMSHCIPPHDAREQGPLSPRMKQAPTSHILNFSSCKPIHPESGSSFQTLLSSPPSILQYDFQQQLNVHPFSGSCISDTSALSNVGSLGTVPNWPLLQNRSNFNARSGVDVRPMFQSVPITNANSSNGCGRSDDLDTLREFISQAGSRNESGIDTSLKRGVNCAPSSSSTFLDACPPTSVTKKQSAVASGCPRVFCMGASGDLLLSSTGLFGILCSCHGVHMSVSNFCEHSGLSDVNPGYAVRIDSGESIAQWRKAYLQKFGIRAPGDHRGWDWPEGLLATSGLANSSMAVADRRKVFDLSSLFNSSAESSTQLRKNVSTSQPRSAKEYSNQGAPNAQLENYASDHCNMGSFGRNLHNTTDNPEIACPTLRSFRPPPPSGNEGSGNDCQMRSFHFAPSQENSFGSAFQNLHGAGSKANDNLKDDILQRGTIPSSIELKLGQPCQLSWGSGSAALSALRPHSSGFQTTTAMDKLNCNVENAKVTEGKKQHIFGNTPSVYSRTKESFEVVPPKNAQTSFQAGPQNNARTSAHGAAFVEHLKDGLHNSFAKSVFIPPSDTTAGGISYQKESKRTTDSHSFTAWMLHHQHHVDRSVLIDFSCNGDAPIRPLDVNGSLNKKSKTMDATGGHKDSYVGSELSSKIYAAQMESSGFTRTGRTCNPSSSTLPAAQSTQLGIINMLGASNYSGNGCSMTSNLDRDQFSDKLKHSLFSFRTTPTMQATSTGFSPISAVLTPGHASASFSNNVEPVSSHASDESERLLALRTGDKLCDEKINDSPVLNQQSRVQSEQRQQSKNRAISDLRSQGLILEQGPFEGQKHRHSYSGQNISSSFLPAANHKKGMNLGAISEEMTLRSKLIDKYNEDSSNPQPKQQSTLACGRQESMGCGCKMVQRSASHISGRCNCKVQILRSKREQDCNGSSFMCGSKEQQNVAVLECSMYNSSRFSNNVSIGKPIPVECSHKGTIHHLKGDCGNSQWIDVPSRANAISKLRCPNATMHITATREEPKDNLKEHSTKGTPKKNQPTEFLKGKEISDISSECSAPAVTQASNEVDMTDSVTIDASHTICDGSQLADQGSAISRSCSSVEGIDSNRNLTPIHDDKTRSTEEEPSTLLENAAHHSVINEYKQTYPKSNGSQNFAASGGSSGEEFNKTETETESEFKSRKRKRTTRWKTLGTPFTIPEISSLPSESRICGGSASKHHVPNEDIQVLHQSNLNLSKFLDVDSNFSSIKRRRSSLYSVKTSCNRYKNGVDDIVEADSVDLVPLNSNDDSIDMPEHAAIRKLRQVKPPEAVKGQVKATEAPKGYWLKNSNSDGTLKCWSKGFKKMKPVACGKYGIICSQELDIDQLKPPKIVPLSQVLKASKRQAKFEKEIATSSKRKKKIISYGGGKKRLDVSSSSHRSQVKRHNKLLLCHNRLIDAPTQETHPTIMDETHSDDPDVLVEDEADEDERNLGVLTSRRTVLSKSKDTRVRSLYELSLGGNELIPADISRSQHVPGAPQTVCGLNNIAPKNAGISEGGESRDARIRSCRKLQSSLTSETDELCCVCGISNKDSGNCLLECGNCLIRIHQACYGITRVPKGDWYCRPCRTSSKDVACVLCGYGGGAMTRAFGSRNVVKSLLRAWDIRTEPNIMSVGSAEALYVPAKIESQNCFKSSEFQLCPPIKPVVHNSIVSGLFDPTVKQWVHMVCGLWTPGTRCPNVDTMSAFDVSGVSHLNAHMVCYICNRIGGSCIRCRVETCYTHFHPWCAHHKGLLQSEVEGVDNNEVGFYGRCLLHANSQASHSENDRDTDLAHSETERDGEPTCARTEVYLGKKQRYREHYSSYQGNSKGGCLVTQVQLDAWLYINRHKLRWNKLPKSPVSDVDHDCRNEYARYKQAKGWKHLVVYKSGIHALGLYTSQFLQRGAMVVEYVGEIVGHRVADKRESEYLTGRKLQYKSACYFFRIDKEQIIDATCKGGIARFVNHSCEPNCVAKVLTVRGNKKVVFFAQRDIYPGEEVTYDYHFNHEDEGKKIPCFCNSKNCRRYLN